MNDYLVRYLLDKADLLEHTAKSIRAAVAMEKNSATVARKTSVEHKAVPSEDSFFTSPEEDELLGALFNRGEK